MPGASADSDSSLLGGLSKRVFLRRHWQKRPLLVRQAFDRSIVRLLDKRRLMSLAGRDDVEARLVERRGAVWRVRHGPIARARFPSPQRRHWTLLVNGVNLHVEAAQLLLQRFAFLSWARIDDLMASFAAPGGGVGPHFDSYDVFLVQGAGRRSWRVASPRNYSLVESAPLKLIDDFQPEDEYLLEPGDMLYLPPGWGHEGTALEACLTYSVGFRAPRAAELAAAFLDWLHDRRLPEADYRDARAKPVTQPGRIPERMLEFARAACSRLAWSSRDIECFLGEHLSSPKPSVAFERPPRPISRAAFCRRLAGAGVALDPKTLLLYRGAAHYLNGERILAPRAARTALQKLADARRFEGAALARCGAAGLMHEWYLLGYINLCP